MKRLVSLLILFFLSLAVYSQSPPNWIPEGKWTHCFGSDSSKTFNCTKGYATFYLNSNLEFILEDSVVCNYQKMAVTGKWVFTSMKLTINRNSTKCNIWSPQIVYSIIWVDNDTFYSSSVSAVEDPGVRYFNVFKRIK